MNNESTILGIDHPIIAVREMAAGRDIFERLGFTVTPRGRHVEWGTGNWCIMFPDDYIEIRGIIDPNSTHNLADFLARREGLMGLAFATSNAQASHDELRERRLDPQPVRQLTRDFELPEGTVQPRFSLCFLNASDTPGLMSVVLCQHLTPELLRRPEWMRHANGARRVKSMSAFVRNLEAAADQYVRLFSSESVERHNGKVVVSFQTGQSLVLTSAAGGTSEWPELDASLVGENGCLTSLTLEIGDIAAAERYLKSKNIDYVKVGDNELRIPPKETCGVALAFVS
jgi:hypothetical protein